MDFLESVFQFIAISDFESKNSILMDSITVYYLEFSADLSMPHKCHGHGHHAQNEVIS